MSGVLAADPPALTLKRAEFVLSDAAEPPADGTGVPVVLPDRWWLSRPDAVGNAWYVLEWKTPKNGPAVRAVYLTSTSLATEVYVNGRMIGATGTLPGPRPRSWNRSQLFVVPAEVMRDGLNAIALRVNVAESGTGAMGPVIAGPEPLLRQRALRDLMVHTIGPAVVSATIIALGLFITVLWIRRRDPLSGLFGLAAILWGVHTALTLSPTQLLPSPHWGIWWTSLYMLFVGLLSLFCLRFTGIDWRLFRHSITAFVVVVPPILYAAWVWKFMDRADDVIRLIGIVFVLLALGAVTRYAWRQRNAESLLLLVAGATSAVFAVHDWLANQAADDLRPVMLVPYAGLAFLMLVGWMLTNRFVRALDEFEALNTNLERRVAEKSEALNQQLAVTSEARDAAEAANRAKTRFLAAASHDLRQPLHALGLFAARLGDRSRDAADTALVDRIQTSVTALDSLFSALLDISRLEAGAVSAEPRPIALQPLLDRLTVEFAPEAIEGELKLAVVPTALAVRSDPLLLERMLRNLLANALRYTAKGGVVVGARRRGDEVALEVWDTGAGIAAEEIDRVFEEFYQVGNRERDRTRGMGLGLAIVGRLAQLLGHKINVSSRPGRGSVFRIVMSRAPADSVVELSAPEFPLSADVLTGCRILIIDDEEPVREAMRQTLAGWGCVTLVAAGADEAIAHCSTHARFDAMLVDFRLRDPHDGLDAIARVRNALGFEVPAIVVSGESASAQLARIKAAGFVLLHKPVAPAKLRAALCYLLAGARG